MAITLFPLCLFLCICVHISVFLLLSISSPVCIYLYILTCFDIVTLHTGTGIVFCSHLCLTLLCFLQTYGTSECWPCTSVVASWLRNNCDSIIDKLWTPVTWEWLTITGAGPLVPHDLGMIEKNHSVFIDVILGDNNIIYLTSCDVCLPRLSLCGHLDKLCKAKAATSANNG